MAFMTLWKAFCLFFCGLSSLVFAQALTLDLKVQPGNTPGTALVQLFPANPESSVFHIVITSKQGERIVETRTLHTTISNLIRGQTYVISAIGLSASGQVKETSPNETVTAP